MANKRKFTKKTIIKAIENSFGVKLRIAARLGCARNTLDNYLKLYPELNQLIADESERVLDIAEEGLYDLMAFGDFNAIRLVLERKGRNRGWGPRTEVTGADGKPVLEIPPELALLMARLGISGADILRNLETELKAAMSAAS